MILNAKEAISRHMKWRMLFQFIVERKESIYPETMQRIRHHDACPIGEWLNSPVLRSSRREPLYVELTSAHVAFHREMIRVADAVNAGQFEAATTMLANGSPFNAASYELANAILAFDRIRTMEIPHNRAAARTPPAKAPKMYL